MSRLSRATIEALWLAAVVVVPIAVNPFGFNYELPRIAILRALVLLMLAAHLLTLAWPPYSPQRKRWWKRPLPAAIVLVLISAVFSTLTSIAPRTSWWGTYHRGQGLYLFLILILWSLLLARHLRTSAQRNRLLWAIVGAGALVAFTPFLETLYWREALWQWRPGGSLGNPIFLGGYLVMVLPFTLVQLLSTDGWQRMLAAQALLLQVLALLVTQSRGPLLGAAAGTALFVTILLWSRRRRVLRFAVLVAVVLIGGILFALNGGVAATRPQLDEIPTLRRLAPAHGLNSRNIRVRLLLWQSATVLVSDWPQIGATDERIRPLRSLVGYGPDTATYAYTYVYPPELAHIEDPNAIWDRAHNELLDILTMRGSLGLLAYLLLGIACIRRAKRRWQTAGNDRQEKLVTAAIMAALLAHVVEIQFAFSILATSMMAWLLVGMLAAPRPTAEAVPTRQTNLLPGTRRWRIYAGIAAMLLAITAVRLEGGTIWADTLVARAHHAPALTARDQIELYDQALALTPWQAAYYQFRAKPFFNLARSLPDDQLALKEGLLTRAAHNLAQAQRLEPLELEYYANSGVLHAYWGTFDDSHRRQSIADYQKALHLAPTRASLWVELGDVYHQFGRFDAAHAQYQQALTIDPDWSQ